MPGNPPAQAASVESVVQAALGLIKSGKIKEAERLYEGIVPSATGIQARLLEGSIAEAKAEFPGALEIIQDALDAHGEHVELLLKKAQLLIQLRRRAEGIATALRAGEICPPDARLLQSIAKVHLQRNDPADARPLLLRATALAPTDPGVLYDAAMCHFYLNEMDEAGVLLERLLALAPGNGFALHVRSQLRSQTRQANHIDELRSTLRRPNLRRQDAISASFALAKELEDVGDYAESFDALREGNRLKRGTLDYHSGNDVRAMQNMAKHYSKEALDRIPRGDESHGPIFILGMPRTGTTLVERVLGSHSAVISVGETVDFPVEMTALAQRTHEASGSNDPDLVPASLRMDYAELGRNYLAAVRQLAGGRPYTIDKLPFNFRYCGQIHQALPNAKILHLTRDPLDTCYAVFKTLFVNAYHFAYQLDELAEYYVAYRQMMDHWHAVLPGVIYDVRYEQLVADPPAQCRLLLERCGLPWQDQVMEFHRSPAASTTASTAQVRQPIYTTSVLKWRNFEAQLQPVLRRLAAAGLVDATGRPLPSPRDAA